MNCENCNKTYATKYTLAKHQKQCQNKEQGQNSEEQHKVFKCEFCNKELGSKRRFEGHIDICKEQKTGFIEKLKAELEEKNDIISRLNIKVAILETQVAEKDKHIEHLFMMSHKPKQDDLGVLDIEHIKQSVVKSISLSVVKRGYKSILKHIAETYLKDKETGNVYYRCVDYSRRKFRFKNNNGAIEEDIECAKLLSILTSSGVLKHIMTLINSDNETSKMFLDNGEYFTITSMFYEEKKFSTDIAKYL